MQILTANQHYSVRQCGGYRAFVETTTRKRWMMAQVNWNTRGRVLAWIGRSFWRVDCPFCTEAIVAEPGQPFYCPNCLMVMNKGMAMEVVFPPERAEIERLLLLRPVPENRNWRVGESVGHLIIENVQHGIVRF